jgi:hypothetical protein
MEKKKAVLRVLGNLLLMLLLGASGLAVVVPIPAASERAASPVTASTTARPGSIGSTSWRKGPPAAAPSSPVPVSQTQRPDPPDDNDGDASDYSQVSLAVIPPLVLGALVGGSFLLYMVRRAKRKRTP